jgi:hypothetical protein
VFATTHLATSATVVSGGLWRFRAATLVGAGHERIGGGKASVPRLLAALVGAPPSSERALRAAEFSR